MRKILLFIFIILMSGIIFAEDFYISDIIVPKTVVEDTNFDINIIIVNTDDIERDINLRVQVYTPDAHLIWDRNYNGGSYPSISIPANDSNNLHISIELSENDSNASTAQHLIRTTIGTADDNPVNNIAQQWFVIRKAQKSTPIPDMPIYFGFIIGIVVAIFIIEKKDKK